MITQTVRCDTCGAIMANGKERRPLLITMIIDRALPDATPPVVTHAHFCSRSCIETALKSEAKPAEEAAHAVAS